MGCEMVVPPVYLSEQEALAIIRGAAEAAGLMFGDAPPGYVATSNRVDGKGKNDRYTLGDGSVGLDLYDAKAGVAAAFITMRGATVQYDGWGMSISDHKPRELAELSAADFAKQKGDLTVGLFYDPGNGGQELYDEFSQKMQELYENYANDSAKHEEKWREIIAEYEAKIRAYQAEQLRAQVLDFIEWLQAQGII